MKTKELKKIAQKIAKFEKIIQENKNSVEVSNAKEEIMILMSQIDSMEDAMQLDELVINMLDN